MALVLFGTVVPFDGSDARAAAVYVGDDGRIEAIQGPTDPPPSGFDAAPRVATDGLIYPGLIDLHNHLAYNLRGLWVPARQKPYTTRYQWPAEATYATEVTQPAHFLHAHAG